ncbi:MAG TPA: hypothetical protein VIK26_00675, partial [Clostridium sp.]
LCLSFNIMRLTPVAAANVFKEGFYKVSDFNFSSNNSYTIQNISPDGSVYVLIFNENQIVQQSMRLEPQSSEYNLLPLKPDYSIVIIGKGEVAIS